MPDLCHARLDCCIVPSLGFPCRASIPVCRTFMCLPGGRQSGLPEFFTSSLPACHGLWTPADLHTLTLSGVSVLPSGDINPSASAITLSRSCASTSGCASPLRPTGFSVYASSVLFALPRSASDARLDMGGWLALSQRGLTPRKMRRALLGAKCH